MNQLGVRRPRRTLSNGISSSENKNNENKMKPYFVKKKIPSSKLFSCILLMIGASVQANAATITWNAIQTATGNASDVVTTGTYFDSAAARPASQGSAITLNTVTFNPSTTGSGTFTGSGITWTNLQSGSSNSGALNPPTAWDDGYEALADWQPYRQTTIANRQAITITLTGLTMNQQYLVQMWTGYWDGANYRTEFRDPSGNSSGFLNLGSTAGGTRDSQYVVGTFTADATTQAILAEGDPAANGYAMPSFMQVRAVPEPSSALLGGLGLLALLRRRRE
jgi:hypothetical protein